MATVTELVEGQNEIIRIQTKVIDELFALLMQHISADEAGRLPCLEKIDQAVTLRKEMGLPD